MSEKLPYFKFFTGEWANGSITLENYSVQGVFINVCCFYWSKQGNVLKTQLEKKIRSKKELSILYSEEIVKIKDEFIIIDFLDSQMAERDSVSKKNSAAGKESARKRAEKKQQTLNEKSTPVEIPLNVNSTIKNKNREEEEQKRIIKEKEVTDSFESFWNLYNKKTNKEKCLKKFSLLKTEEIKLLMLHVPKYVKSTPDRQYRKNPETYLNNKSFNDEIISSEISAVKTYQAKHNTGFNDNNSDFAPLSEINVNDNTDFKPLT